MSGGKATLLRQPVGQHPPTRENPPDIILFILEPRRPDRWLSGHLTGLPHSAACRVLEAEFQHPVERLLTSDTSASSGRSSPEVAQPVPQPDPGRAREFFFLTGAAEVVTIVDRAREDSMRRSELAKLDRIGGSLTSDIVRERYYPATTYHQFGQMDRAACHVVAAIDAHRFGPTAQCSHGDEAPASGDLAIVRALSSRLDLDGAEVALETIHRRPAISAETARRVADQHMPISRHGLDHTPYRMINFIRHHTPGRPVMSVSSTANLIRRLQADWEHLVESRAAAQALIRWGTLEPALRGWRNLDELRAAVHDRTDPARSDQILSALVRLAAVTGHSDELAARVVLQLLVPGAIRLHLSNAARTRDLLDSESAVFAHLAILIRTYPWQRRTRHTAANLLLDCRQRLSRSRRRNQPEVPVGLNLDHDSGRATTDRSDDMLELYDLLHWARRQGVLNELEVELLVANRVKDIPIDTLAKQYGRSRSSLFQIRAAAERRLRQALTTEPHRAGRDRQLKALSSA